MATIETRKSRGKTVWRVRYRLGKQQKVLTCATQDGAERFVSYGNTFGWQAAHDAARQVTEPEPDITLAEWVAVYIAGLSGITSGTRATYRGYLDRHIAPWFADMPLTQVTAAVSAEWVATMLDDGASGKSIRNRHALLSGAMAQAARAGKVADNPLRGQRLPRTLKREMCFLEAPEFAILLDGAPEHYHLFISTLAATGIRFGEATALRVRHVEKATSSLRIVQAWKATGNGADRELGVPKSRASVRTVAVPDLIMRQITEHARGRKPDDLLFTNADGNVIRQGTFYRNAWTPAVAALAGDATERRKNPRSGRYEAVVVTRGDGKRPRVHDLRHTFAAWAIQSGTPLPVIQRQLGHESITTTVDTYGHLARADYDAMAARIGANLPQTVGLLPTR